MSHPVYTPVISTIERNHIMNTTQRIDTFVGTLHEARKAGSPANYTNDNPTDKLIILTGNISDLCWEIAAGTKQADPAAKIIMADSIKHNATNIINICITELENLGRTNEAAIELITTDGALWFWSLSAPPLNKLDQEISPLERIQSLNVAMGNLAECWPIDISVENHLEIASKLEQVFVNLAYEATCTIIAHDYTTETETHND